MCLNMFYQNHVSLQSYGENKILLLVVWRHFPAKNR